MNAFHFSTIFFALCAVMSARNLVKREAGSNTYGDEPAVATAAPAYDGEAPEETTIIPVEEEPQAVENVPSPAEAAVVESGYRFKRQAGDNSYGDEPVAIATPAYGEEELTTIEAAPEEEVASVPSEPVVAEPVVEESGYRA